MLAGQAEHVDAAGVLDQLRGPVAGDEDRVEPLERGDPHRLLRAHGEAHLVDPARGVLDEVDAGVLGVGRGGERPGVAEHLAERVRVERDHLRLGLDPLRDLDDVVVGDRADRAQRLRDDQVGLQRAQPLLVERVDRLALLGQLAHRAIDLGGREPGADQVARDLGQLERLRGVVALVCHGGDLVAQPQREQHLGRGGDEGDDAHEEQDMAAGIGCPGVG